MEARDELRVALERDRRRLALQRRDREDLAAHLVHGRLRPEGVGLLGAGEAQAQLAKVHGSAS